MREAFALQKLLTFFSTKHIGIFQILTFEILNETLTKDVVSFEQPGPGSCASLNPLIKQEDHDDLVLIPLETKRDNTVNSGYLKVKVHPKLLIYPSKFSGSRKFILKYQ